MNPHATIDMERYRYDLPEERIAKYPLERRDDSKLLLYRKGVLEHRHFSGLPGALPPGSWLVFNNTRVIQARMLFSKDTGASIEIFCLEPSDPPEYQRSFLSRSGCTWKCLVGNARKWKAGPVTRSVERYGQRFSVQARLMERLDDHHLVHFTWDDQGLSFAEVLEMAGSTPIPPYLNRSAEEKDRDRYQTVYSRNNGSVAAPTAGLHFTKELLNKLSSSGVRMEEITLHVGAGTFVPVKSRDAREHMMHAETASVSTSFLRRWRQETGGLIAVGTTTIRSLETLHWLGVRLAKGMLHQAAGREPDMLFLDQWEDLDLPADVTLEQSLDGLLEHCHRHGLEQIRFSTRLMIVPGYTFRTISGLLTNFHLPGSSLLLLVAALIGADWRRVYDYALQHQFRFLSYGDSSLLIPG